MSLPNPVAGKGNQEDFITVCSLESTTVDTYH
jgi:hypothetical protein